MDNIFNFRELDALNLSERIGLQEQDYTSHTLTKRLGPNFARAEQQAALLQE